tara:strand:+ start:523 stop:651 length:129 start_codon:yes stop_codon:yes gene_type:complete
MEEDVEGRRDVEGASSMVCNQLMTSDNLLCGDHSVNSACKTR